MKSKLLAAHRYISLVFALLWLMQAATGIVLVYRWELDDAAVEGITVPIDLAALEKRIASLRAEYPQWHVDSMWTSGGNRDRFDIYLTHADGRERIWRVDGGGRILRTADAGEPLSSGIIYDTLTELHHTVFLGDAGHWLIGLSGLLLVSNIALGLKMAWPSARRWRQAMLPAPAQSAASWSYTRHRALGLWFCVPAIVLVFCGALINFEDPIRAAIGAEIALPVKSEDNLASETPPSLSQGVAAAMGLYPGASMTALVLPTPDEPWYRLRLLQPEESRRIYGKTTLFLDPESMKVVGTHDPFQSSIRHRAMDLLYPVHTGEALGWFGRILVLVMGVWLMAMLGLGIRLWLLRRPNKVNPESRSLS